MNNKEMLQEIKKRVDRLVGFESASDDDLYYISKKHINWFIEQAEKVQELQQENKYYKEQLDISRDMAADIIVGLQKELMEYKNKPNNK